MPRLKIGSLLLLMTLMGNANAGLQNTPLLMGVFPYISATRIVKLYGPLVRFLERESGREIRLVSAPSFRQFIKRCSTQSYALIHNAPHFALREKLQGRYVPIYRFEKKLKGVVFVRSASPVHSVEQLRGTTVAMPDALAVVSMLGEVYFSSIGLEAGRDYTVLHTASHNNTILAVLGGKVNAGVMAGPVLQMFENKQPGRLRVIAETAEIPGAMFQLSSRMDQQLQAKFRQAFAKFTETPAGKVFFHNSPFTGLSKVTPQDLKSLEQYLPVLDSHLAKQDSAVR